MVHEKMEIEVTNVHGDKATQSLQRGTTAKVVIACGGEKWTFDSYDDFGAFMVAHGLNHHQVAR